MPGTVLEALRPYLTKAARLLSLAPEDILGDLLCPPNLHQDLKINSLEPGGGGAIKSQPDFKHGSSHLSPTTAAPKPSLYGNPCTGEQHLSSTAHTAGKPGPGRLRKLPKEPSARKRPA